MKKVLDWKWIAIVMFLVCLAIGWIGPLVQGRNPIKLGLDLSGGVQVTYRPDFSKPLAGFEDRPREELLSLAKETLSTRLRRVSETIPEVVIRADDRIVVSIPGTSDHRRALEQIGRTYRLTWRLVLDRHLETGGRGDLVAFEGSWLELAPAEVSGDMLEERSIRVVTGDGLLAEPKVAFRFAAPHDQVFAKLTGSNIGGDLAILLDDEVQWVGRIENEIVGAGSLGGGYSQAEAEEVASLLRSGTLPLALEVEDLTLVGPSLGQEILDLGSETLLLSFVALAGVIALAYGSRPWLMITGWISLICLLFLITGLVAVFDLTLDSVAIAGLVLSVGMGMDAFIMVFERLLKRRPSGPQLKSVLKGVYSFRGEGRTLFHANATTLLVMLLLLGSDRLESFAAFICVGILASLLTLVVTRSTLLFFSSAGREPRFDALGWLRNSRPRLFRFRKLYFVGFAAMILVTFLAGFSAGGDGPQLTLGPQFKPGTQLIVSASEADQLDQALEDLEDRYPEVDLSVRSIDSADRNRWQIHFGMLLDGQEPGDYDIASSGLTALELTELLGKHEVDLESLNSIDPYLSSSRLLRSLWVFVFSFLLLAFYFLVFEGLIDRIMNAGQGYRPSAGTRWLVFLGVLFAVVIDVSSILIVLSWLQIALSLGVVAGLLTIIGYSVNDSVVLWSHIQQKRAEKGGRIAAREVVSSAVDEILGRAVLTSMSTSIPAWILLAVGMSPLQDFAWVILVGTVAGTLSSIFVVGSFALFALGCESRERVIAKPMQLA